MQCAWRLFARDTAVFAMRARMPESRVPGSTRVHAFCFLSRSTNCFLNLATLGATTYWQYG
jgi:hypothetical protein